jgi:ABC-type uncharacterized transport system YnjBCD ATPase subunit
LEEVISMDLSIVPGTLVRHPLEPGWGLGMVQSVIGHRVTVNFEHRGKVLIDTRYVTLVPASQERHQGTR